MISVFQWGARQITGFLLDFLELVLENVVSGISVIYSAAKLVSD